MLTIYMPTDDEVAHTETDCICGPAEFGVNAVRPDGSVHAMGSAWVHHRIDGEPPRRPDADD